MTRCCLCRQTGDLEPAGWPLPVGAFRCPDYAGCAERVREIVKAHQAWSRIV